MTIVLWLQQLPSNVDERSWLRVFPTNFNMQQIHMCFDAISCFALPYPGRAVDNDTFDGDVGMVNASFLRLLDVYVRHIFKEAVGKVLRGKRVVLFACWIVRITYLLRRHHYTPITPPTSLSA